MLRKILFWTHLTAGVVAGAIIAMLSVTGVLLTYEKQIAHWADLRTIQPINAPVSTHLRPDSLIVLASAANGGKAATAITLRSDSTKPAQIGFGSDGLLFLNPSTGAVLGAGSPATHEFFESVEHWHRWMAGEGDRRKLFKSVTGVANLMFLVLVLTGMVLWLPKTWTWIRFKSVLWFRKGLTGKARDFNWHNVLGIWSALPLVAIVASGSVIGFPWASDLVYKVVGEAPPPRTPPGGPVAGAPASAGTGQRAAAAGAVEQPKADVVTGRASYAAMLSTALPLMPEWKAVTLQLPKPDAKTVTVTLDRGTGGQPQHRATVQLAPGTGALVKYQPFDSLSTGRRLRSVLRFTHTGEVLGLAGQTLAGLVSLASVVLVVTGVTLAIRRAARAIGRRRERVPALDPAPALPMHAD
ncbi:MAG TPA: PepSY-associated TM helix domain-containing protein [Gemmatimonadaceae bacterium]|nr:PepSY-associated TM helix domain-containing protein [Gemmatimonadaceae bacterium]